jgi:hypothetical protein
MVADPKAVERKRENLRSSPDRVVVKAKGRAFEAESDYARGTNFTDFRISDEDLVTKFRSNASGIAGECPIRRLENETTFVVYHGDCSRYVSPEWF